MEAIREAEAEARAEKERIAREAEMEANRLKAQAANEIERKTQQVKAELRRFSAEESIRLAEEKLKAQMSADKDARLVKASLQSIGGLN
jgi:F0F1-type ATP synthase membrane subunit b/b'